MAYDFSSLKARRTEVEEWLGKELSAIRTGRATPSILDGVKIDSYGAQVPINHAAGVTIEDAKTLRITPWDKGQIKDIEGAINSADLGLSVAADDSGIRVIFPELTADRRDQLVKVLKSKIEEAKVSLRGIRDEVWGDIQKKEKDGEITEDDKFRFKDEMQKLIDEGTKTFDEMGERKEKELAN